MVFRVYGCFESVLEGFNHACVARHALEAFAHKIGKSDMLSDSFLTRTANHNSSTSAYYGRDQNAVVNIPADITEANLERYVCGTALTIILSDSGAVAIDGTP